MCHPLLNILRGLKAGPQLQDEAFLMIIFTFHLIAALLFLNVHLDLDGGHFKPTTQV